MKNSQLQRLQQQLNEKAGEVVKESLNSDGHVSNKDLENLERISRLIQVYKANQPPSPPKRKMVVIVLCLTLLIISFLLFIRVRETEIELDVQISEASFVLPKRQLITRSLPARSLGFAGIQEVLIPRSSEGPSRKIASDRGIGLSILLSEDEQEKSTLTLSAIELEPETSVTIKPLKEQGKYKVSIQGNSVEMSANAHGRFTLLIAEDTLHSLEFNSPRAIKFVGDSQHIDLDVEKIENTPYDHFPTQLEVKDLSVSQIFQYTGEKGSIIKRLSTILSGKIYFESLNGQERTLRPSEDLRFKSSLGEIRNLEIENDHLHLQFTGTVRGMTVGTENTQRSLMPTYLEWLKARHGLSLLWGSTLYVFGILMTILRWWGKL